MCPSQYHPHVSQRCHYLRAKHALREGRIDRLTPGHHCGEKILRQKKIETGLMDVSARLKPEYDSMRCIVLMLLVSDNQRSLFRA